MTITNKKTIHLQWIISFVFDALGIILLTISKQSEGDLSINLASQYLGILLGLCAGLTYAVYSWSARQMIEKGIHSKSSMASMFGLAALLLLPSLLFTGENLFSNSLHTNVALYMAIIPMFLGYLCFSHGLRYIDASKATLITLLEPVVATLLAVMIIGEDFGLGGWIGMMLIIICLILQVVKLPTINKNYTKSNLSL